MTLPQFQSEPKTALVSGGTFGIGRATAWGLARQGFTVVITGRDAGRAEYAVAAMERESGKSNVSFLLADSLEAGQICSLARSFI